jgi:hypothetical protein
MNKASFNELEAIAPLEPTTINLVPAYQEK